MKKLGMLVAGLGCVSFTFAMPTGFESVAGHAAMTEIDQTMIIKAKNSSIIHWDDFSVSSQESVVFKLPSSKSAILNRVSTNAKSKLYGKIDSNGKVYIANPNGIVIGPNANLTAAGFLLTTGHVSEDEFLKGGALTVRNIGEEKGRIINLGSIESPSGDIYIISKRIINNGSLIAPEGHAGMAMGDEVLIKPQGPERIFIKAGNTRAAGEHITAIDNHGKIEALVTELKTNANIYAQAIRHSGSIDATSTKQKNGRVYLVSEGSRVIGHGKITANGGDVEINALNDVALMGEALVDVSHSTKPGTVKIGSETCKTVSISESSTIKADATVKGHGGKVKILSYESNRFDGHISAEGNQGNGGHVDVSSKSQGLEYRGTVSLKGHGGKDGNLVLDPKYIIVQGFDPYSDPATGQTFASDPTGSVTISSTNLSAALDSANVTLQANTDITIYDPVEGTTSGNGLTLQSGRSIIFSTEGSVTLNNGAFSATINDQNAVSADRESGTAQFNGLGSFTGAPKMISTQGGDISINVGTFGGSQEGNVVLNQSILDAGGGNITIEGFGSMATGKGAGVTLYSPVSISTNSTGTINITGTGAANTSSNFGVYSSGSEFNPSVITAVDGNVTLTGNGGGDGTATFNCGCYLNSLQVSTTGSGTATVNGTGGTGTNLNCGIILTGSGALVTSETGAVVVDGTGNGTLEFNYGVRLEGGAKITSTGAATVDVTGNGASATACNVGVILSGRGSNITSTGGNITITGDGGGTAYLNQGVRVETNGAIEAINSAAINITGNGAGSGNYDNGIYVSGIGSHITSVNGNNDLNGTGTGAGPSNQGVILEYPAENASCTGTGTLTINSTP